MVTRTEYISTIVLWGPLSAVCVGLIVLGFTLSPAITLWDMVVCAVLSVFGITRIALSSMQFRGRRFFGRRDRFDIWTGLACLLALPSLLYLGHVKRGEWLIVLPSDKVLACMAALFLIFLFVTVKATRKYIRTKRILRKYEVKT